MPSRANPIEHLRAVIAAQRDIVRGGPDLSVVMQTTTERARELTSADAAALELRRGDRMVYEAVSGTAESMRGLTLAVEGSLSGLAVRERRTLSCVDTESDQRVDVNACRRIGARSMLCVPLLDEGLAIGVLKVYSGETAHFNDEDVGTLELMVGFIAAATSQAVAQHALAVSELRFRSLAELASDAIVTADARGTITFCNRSAERMFGYVEPELVGRPFTVLMPPSHPIAAAMAAGRFDPDRTERLLGRAMELTGIRRDRTEFPVEVSSSRWSVGGEREFATIIRDISERKRLEQAVLTLARTDHLTGLLNRRAGDEVFQHEVVRARRYGRQVSLLLLDIDHFKRINDSAGHAVGDTVLRRLAELVMTRIRGSDVAIRWGGEEFLLVLPETDTEGARGLAEGLRSLIEHTSFGGVGRVTTSIGGVEIAPLESVEHAIARADAKLYEAKRQGRNRVLF